MDQVASIAALLSEAGSAHGRYEEAELNGVYDQSWPDWYAAYLLQQRLGEIVLRTISQDELSAFLKQCDVAYRNEQAAMGWPDFYAQRLATTYGS